MALPDHTLVDYGLVVGAGVDISPIQIGISYDLGLANISAYTDGGNKVGKRILGFCDAYTFAGK